MSFFHRNHNVYPCVEETSQRCTARQVRLDTSPFPYEVDQEEWLAQQHSAIDFLGVVQSSPWFDRTNWESYWGNETKQKKESIFCFGAHKNHRDDRDWMGRLLQKKKESVLLCWKYSPLYFSILTSDVSFLGEVNHIKNKTSVRAIYILVMWWWLRREYSEQSCRPAAI